MHGRGLRLAERAGVSVSLVQHYFGDNANLLQTTLQIQSEFMEALIAEKGSSQTLRRHIEGEYLLRFKTLPAGVPPPRPSQFAPETNQMSAPKFRALRGYTFDPSLSASLALIHGKVSAPLKRWNAQSPSWA